MTPVEQLELWVAGQSVHNHERGECCPDFSCCSGQPAAELEVRQRFLKAHQEGDEPLMDMMLGLFLTQAITRHCGKCVHVAGDPVVEQ